MRYFLYFFGIIMVPLSSGAATEMPIPLWPTPNEAFFEGKPETDYIQPTSLGGKTESGLFGCVRNEGHKFHEGLDLKAVMKRDRCGEATDTIKAVFAGQVKYINKIGGNSLYGRYIVIQHSQYDLPIHTFYAHLSSVSVKVGQEVKAGDVIGIMGRSSSGKILKDLSHLHFEMGVQLSSVNFNSWYQQQKYPIPNQHGIWNGFNLVGFDPLNYYNKSIEHHVKSITEYIKNLPTDFKLRIITSKVPDFIRRYPSLLTKSIPANVAGWDIEFTWYGLPKSWTPLSGQQFSKLPSGTILPLSHDTDVVSKTKGNREMIVKKGSKFLLGKNLKRFLCIMFNMRENQLPAYLKMP